MFYSRCRCKWDVYYMYINIKMYRVENIISRCDLLNIFVEGSDNELDKVQSVFNLTCRTLRCHLFCYLSSVYKNLNWRKNKNKANSKNKMFVNLMEFTIRKYITVQNRKILLLKEEYAFVFIKKHLWLTLRGYLITFYSDKHICSIGCVGFLTWTFFH